MYYNIIFKNAVNSNKGNGIYFTISNYNIVSYNAIESNGGRKWVDYGLGVFLDRSSNNEIHYNNFLNNARDAYFHESFSNNWNRNYWNRPRIFPKIIHGETIAPFFDWRINIDWRPARKPYDI